MDDIFHIWGGDIYANSSADLMVVDGDKKTQQRILRRLMTNPGDYLMHPNYGAGLPKFIGEVADLSKIKAVILGQVLLEDSVSRFPAPAITVSKITNGLACSISYTDSVSNTPQILSFNVTP